MESRGFKLMRMVNSLLIVMVMVVDVMMERTAAQMMMQAASIFPLDKCDFHFLGHSSIPPVFNLQSPGLHALSSNIITRGGQALRSASTAARCVFPGNMAGVAGEEVEQKDREKEREAAKLCAKHFHMEVDKLVTKSMKNISSELYTKTLNGRHVRLPLTSVDLQDGTQLRQSDGNDSFPESRRCLSFFTATDITSILDRVLNKAHRKKLSKITQTADRFRYDFNTLLNGILQFP